MANNIKPVGNVNEFYFLFIKKNTINWFIEGHRQLLFLEKKSLTYHHLYLDIFHFYFLCIV